MKGMEAFLCGQILAAVGHLVKPSIFLVMVLTLIRDSAHTLTLEVSSQPVVSLNLAL